MEPEKHSASIKIKQAETILSYAKYFDDLSKVKEIDHVTDTTYADIAASDEKALEDGIIIVERSMGVSFSTFSKLYPLCKKATTKRLPLTQFDENDLHYLDLSTKILLCLNGEVGSAFTIRKGLLDCDYFKDLKSELHFVELICLRYKKSSVSWAYRREVILKCLSKPSLLSKYNVESDPKQFVRKLFAKESKFLAKMLNKYPRNYYAWTYKIFLFDELLTKYDLKEDIGSEVRNAHDYCERHVHDYSSFHYLQHILLSLKNKEKLTDNIKWIESVKSKFDVLYGLEKKDPNPNSETNYTKLESLMLHKRVIQKILREVYQEKCE